MSGEDEPVKLPWEKIDKRINEILSKEKYARLEDVSKAVEGSKPKSSGPFPPEPSEAGHTHKPEEFLPAYVKSYRCPDGNCAKIHENPKFDKESEWFCSDCGHSYGTEENAAKAPKCPGCGRDAPAMHIPRRDYSE